MIQLTKCKEKFGNKCLFKIINYNSKNIKFITFVHKIGLHNVLLWVETPEWKIPKGVEKEMRFIANSYADYCIDQIIKSKSDDDSSDESDTEDPAPNN